MIQRPLTEVQATLDELLEHGASGCEPCQQSDETANLCPIGRPLVAAHRAAWKRRSAKWTERWTAR